MESIGYRHGFLAIFGKQLLRNSFGIYIHEDFPRRYMQSISLNTNQKVHVTAVPKDATGASTSNFNPGQWSVTGATGVVTIANISPDGLQADIVAQSAGTTRIKVQGQQGNFMPTYFTEFDVTVTPGLPESFVFVFDAPVPKV